MKGIVSDCLVSPSSSRLFGISSSSCDRTHRPPGLRALLCLRFEKYVCIHKSLTLKFMSAIFIAPPSFSGDLCYCFVCDLPASQCHQWCGHSMAHCLASDQGNDGALWKNARDQAKKKKGRLSSIGAEAGIVPSPFEMSDRAQISRGTSDVGRISQSRLKRQRRLQDESDLLYGARPGRSAGRAGAASRLLAVAAGRLPPTPVAQRGATVFSVGKGPWKPGVVRGPRKPPFLTQCRKCKWYTAFAHQNFTRKKDAKRGRSGETALVELNDVGTKDMCHACGRIASKKDFMKEQAVAYVPVASDVCLGTKTISFRVRSYDPRKLDPFKDLWAEHGDKTPGWKFSAAEMEHDTFMHRIGERPTLHMILQSIPIIEEKELPETGVVDRYDNRRWQANRKERQMYSASEVEAVLVGSRNHRVLLEELGKFDEVYENTARSKGRPLNFNITASFDAATRKGTFSAVLYLSKVAFMSNAVKCGSQARISRVLGALYDVFPFSLADLTMGLKATPYSPARRKVDARFGFPVPPFRSCTDAELEDYCKDTEEQKQAISLYNASAQAIRKNLSFHSSSGKSYGGGVSNNDMSLYGTLKRFFSACIIDDGIEIGSHSRLRMGWVGRQLKLVAHHRDGRGGYSSLVGRSSAVSLPFASYLRDEDHAIFVENVAPKVCRIHSSTKTFSGLVQHLENLGHEAAAQPDGINVDLLDFQKQALGWAIERENNPGGVAAFLWAELPRRVDDFTPGYSGKLYFSPLLDKFSQEMPAVARGGLICETMGLGKTVESLSLVLQNPAPDSPQSGTIVRGYRFSTQNIQNAPPGWTVEKMDKAGHEMGRGSIFSRGTLVVCNVSLVGQWIDEARSKLKNPGLVYSYHGTNRSRNANILAEKSIVVTTYATLASDATFHAKKSNSRNYCPPTEQIRWWRIICDESHVMRSNTSQTSALLSLQAENKWCVTGTPINTRVQDLKNQVSFIGIDHVDAMFRLFAASMHYHNGSGGKGTRRRSVRDHEVSPFGSVKDHEVGPFSFLMRPILMRHTMEQRCRQSNHDLMALPNKVERVIKIRFSADESERYDKLQTTALASYSRLRARGRVNLSKHHLRLLSLLLPLRMACSGGALPDRSRKAAEDGISSCKQGHYQMKASDDVECSICLDVMDNPLATSCKPVPHVFCKECIQGVIGVMDESNGPCPICRTDIKIKSLKKALLPKIVVDEGDSPVGDDSKEVFKSKLAKLLEELKRIRDTEPRAKSLVFSQFASTLSWLKEELPKHGFEYKTLAGSMSMSKRAKALRDFQNDPPTTIFLLSMRAGAVGINLTQANRVFLMEPALNPALEAQAIGRVHRLGQTSTVEVLRLVMENSLETRMTALLEEKYGTKSEARGHSESALKSSNMPNATSGSSRKKKESTASVATGSLVKDKAQMAMEEFDSLFRFDEADHIDYPCLEDDGPAMI